jgi:hexosaminidase
MNLNLSGLVYNDMLDVFDNDVFHMGGDEVNLNCWNSSSDITSYLKKHGKDLSQKSFLELWGNFQARGESQLHNLPTQIQPLHLYFIHIPALKLLKEKSKDPNITTILWTSELVSKEHVKEYLSKDDYIVQIWTEGKDEVIPYLIKEGYRVIFSNYDAWYFDCGYGAWVGGGPTNW